MSIQSTHYSCFKKKSTGFDTTQSKIDDSQNEFQAVIESIHTRALHSLKKSDINKCFMLMLVLCYLFLAFITKTSAQITSSSQWAWMSGDSVSYQSGFYGTRGITAIGNKPGGRYDGISWKDANGNFWLMGGFGIGTNGTYDNLNDLWKYNTNSGQWTWMSGDSVSNQYGVYGQRGVASASNKPGARNGSISWSDANGNL